MYNNGFSWRYHKQLTDTLLLLENPPSLEDYYYIWVGWEAGSEKIYIQKHSHELCAKATYTTLLQWDKKNASEKFVVIKFRAYCICVCMVAVYPLLTSYGTDCYWYCRNRQQKAESIYTYTKPLKLETVD